MISLKNITHAYGDKIILEDFNLSISKGKTTILIGPSGCGKSTILRLMIGLLLPVKGDVFVGKEKLGPENVRALRLQMGYVIQDGGLFPNMTARKNITLMANLLGQSARQIRQRVDALCTLAHFDVTLLDQYPSRLSGGQRQRVSLMRALMLDPQVLLLDEPLAALDPVIRAGLHDSLKEIFARLGKTVIMVTHDMHEAAYLGQEIVLLNDGRIEQRASIETLVKNPASDFVHQFIRAQRSHLPEVD